MFSSKRKKIFTCIAKYQNISSHVLKISTILVALCTREISDIFNSFDIIHLVFSSKSKYPLYLHFRSLVEIEYVVISNEKSEDRISAGVDTDWSY